MPAPSGPLQPLKQAVQLKKLAGELADAVRYANPDYRDTVVVVTVYGGLGNILDTEAATPQAGRRIVRLAYPLEKIAPIVWLPLVHRAAALQALAAPGEVLRARVRAAQEFGR